jgi:Transcriptional regulator
MSRTNGRIADESRQRIGAALFELMKVYNFKEITVTQLAQEAELSRKIFYRLFNDKDDVLKIVFDRLFYDFFF